MAIMQDIKRHEGVVYGIYLDSLGKPTAGVGHLINDKSEFSKSKAKQIKKLTSAFNNRLKELQESSPDLNEIELIELKAQIAEEVNSKIAGKKKVKGEDNVATYVTNDEFSLSPEKVEKTFEIDFNEKGIKQAKINFPDYEEFPANIQNALVNMSYQLGTISTKEWPSFHAALNYGLKTQDYTHAAHHASDSKWFNQTKRRAKEVTDMMGGIAEEPLTKKEMDSYVAPPEPRPKKEKEVPQVEEQAFLDRVGDFFSNTFGMSAEASDVPPMETLEQPQEEVLMSPTDAMRAQSQGRVVLDSAQSVPTNPEAGPSDTVPAMLTPGEAVIPAAAAQDPDNIPVIEKMIKEGRAKNRMAEANGVPVNGKEAIMYDDAELDAYHKRNKTGKYGSGEMSLQGFAGGTMDVPAMIMMAPPKDPAMDEMEKLALKQMGYEQKSKNRTRDTIEKIGLKHLEETATAEMRQAALDETMRNYGLEVPMPMQPVPQGFQDGTPGLYDERPELSFAQTALSGLAGPATGLYDDKTDADLAEISRFSPVAAQADAAQRELERRQAETLTGAEVTQIDPADPIKVAGSDITVQPSKAVPVVTPVEAPPNVMGSSNIDVSDILSDDKPDEPPTPTEPTLGETIGSAFKEVFDPTSLTKAAIAYGVNRAMGYDKNVATQQAAQQYGLEQKRISSAQTAAAKRQADLEDYALKQRIAAGITSPKEDREAQLQFNNRLRDNLKATAVQVNRRTVKGKKTDEPEFNLGNTEQGFAAEATSFMRNSGIPIGNPEVQDQMDSIINQSYRDMVTYQRETGNKAGSIIPFIRQNLRASTLGESANREFELGKREDGTAIIMDPRKSMDVDNIIDSEVNRMLKGMNRKPGEVGYYTLNALRRRVFEDMQEDFATFDQSTIKPGEEETGFYVFATQHYNK